MDVNKTLRELYEEKRRLDATIAVLESQLGVRSNARRGRKSMSPEERQEVSKRMAKYWEARRAAMKALDGLGDLGSNPESTTQSPSA